MPGPVVPEQWCRLRAPLFFEAVRTAVACAATEIENATSQQDGVLEMPPIHQHVYSGVIGVAYRRRPRNFHAHSVPKHKSSANSATTNACHTDRDLVGKVVADCREPTLRIHRRAKISHVVGEYSIEIIEQFDRFCLSGTDFNRPAVPLWSTNLRA